MARSVPASPPNVPKLAQAQEPYSGCFAAATGPLSFHSARRRKQPLCPPCGHKTSIILWEENTRVRFVGRQIINSWWPIKFQRRHSPRSAIRPHSTHHHLKPACPVCLFLPPRPRSDHLDLPWTEPQRLCASVPLPLSHPPLLSPQASPVSSCLTCYPYPLAPYTLGPHLRVCCHVRLWRLVIIGPASSPLHSPQSRPATLKCSLSAISMSSLTPHIRTIPARP